MAAWIWLGAGIALMAAEMLSGDFWLVLVGVGALAGAGASALTDNQWIAVAVFSIASLGLLIFARPALKRRFLHGIGMKTNTEALIGAKAVALSEIDSNSGLVKLAGGEWTARNNVPGHVIKPGTTVTVVEISGATAIVSADPLMD
ncbi:MULTISPECIES: NfeD family protein [Thermocrispum]|jgi:membrane protein implicated in regulation of membrane protease activity|uniref:NfeD family protein n=1 Tax=Thermocrispum agreste TaxID=37925 RepID=A0A2W4JMN6_9PSEU|nr:MULTISPECIES: NfeD family protein [Thermocrispum]PZN00313.1 MAG: NfeD family protein [Thermocrispum agreste]